MNWDSSVIEDKLVGSSLTVLAVKLDLVLCCGGICEESVVVSALEIAVVVGGGGGGGGGGDDDDDDVGGISELEIGRAHV